LAAEARCAGSVFEKLPVFQAAREVASQSFPDTVAIPLQPQSALFHQESDAHYPAVGSGWFLFGVWVLLALIFGGLSGYAAVSKGLNPIPHFFIGFFLSALGYIYVLTRPALAKRGEVPAGLVKVHTTFAPMPCPQCGSTQHPAATKCLGCGAELQPLTQSEVIRVKPRA
jgi:hypothetical protein